MELICRLFSLQTAVHFFFFNLFLRWLLRAREPSKVMKRSQEGLRSFTQGKTAVAAAPVKRDTFQIK